MDKLVQENRPCPNCRRTYNENDYRKMEVEESLLSGINVICREEEAEEEENRETKEELRKPTPAVAISDDLPNV